MSPQPAKHPAVLESLRAVLENLAVRLTARRAELLQELGRLKEVGRCAAAYRQATRS